MKRIPSVALGLVLCLSLPLKAETVVSQVNQGSPDEYVVKKGDTLWSIAGYFLDKSSQWPQLWKGNPQIDNPELIYPDDIIQLKYVNGIPQFSINRAYEKRSPAVREVRRGETMRGVPTKIIEEFLRNNKVTSELQLKGAPYVIGGISEKIYFGAQDEFYAQGLFSEADGNYNVFRKGESYIDPDSGDLLGHQITQIGTAELLVATGQNLARLKAIETKTPFTRGDRLLSQGMNVVQSAITLTPSSAAVYGTIMAIQDDRNSAGPMGIVALNRGRLDGLEPGNLLDLFVRGESLKAIDARTRMETPERRIGNVLVFLVDEKMSHGIILQTSQQVSSGDIVKTP